MTLTNERSEFLTKIMRLATQCSADALADMVNQDVSMQLENFHIIGSEDIPRMVQGEFGPVGAINRLRFTSETSGSALLLMPKGQDDLFVSAALMGEVEPEMPAGLKHSVLIEAGNVILNAYVGTIANELDIQVQYELPELFIAPEESEIPLITAIDSRNSVPWILMTSRMSIGTQNITIYIMVVCQPEFLA